MMKRVLISCLTAAFCVSLLCLATGCKKKQEPAGAMEKAGQDMGKKADEAMENAPKPGE